MNSLRRNKTIQRRRQTKKFIRRFFMLLAVIVVILFILASRGLFNVTAIRVTGNGSVKQTDIIKASGFEIGQNYFGRAKSTRIEDIKKLPQLDNVKISMNFSRQVNIEVALREAKYQVENFMEYFVLDDELRIIDTQSDALKVPIIHDTFDKKELKLGNFLYQDTALNFLKMLNERPLYDSVAQIDLAQGNFTLTLQNGVTVIFGSGDNLEYKFKILDQILKDIEITGKKVRRIDLDKDNPVVVVDEFPGQNATPESELSVEN
ncbi:cell division protein FtsQ/DivIB [Peptoniphilus equinus]|uniref:Cell division protein FtsQ/DivIB n=1 Tax=Peptoniphilus equinus TaxID=3016343 RepID=A0ABY7QR52_9FIRM|nr:FtsQ-type POTRA domain-containing protein [Peptoniphilus equinus]WBW49267.1 cell division protein FtsQ/DivIB [Peptoniphilus equinus]